MQLKEFFSRVRVLTLLCVLLLVCVASQAITHTQTKFDTRVIAVETYFDTPAEHAAGVDEVRKTVLIEAVREALIANPDSIILPEDVRFSDFFSTQEDVFTWMPTVNPQFTGTLYRYRLLLQRANTASFFTS